MVGSIRVLGWVEREGDEGQGKLFYSCVFPFGLVVVKTDVSLLLLLAAKEQRNGIDDSIVERPKLWIKN